MIEIIEKACDELIPYENNARINDKAVESVAKSIKEFGFKNPIIIDKDGMIVAGHTRLKAAQQLELKTVPCIIADDLTDDQIKAFRIADNSTAQIATWNLEKLNTELASIDLDMAMFGLDEQLKDIEKQFAKEVIEDEVPEVEDGEPTCKLGDIWQLGRHRLMCGDSTDKETVDKLMGGGLADLLITDPPYNVDYEGKTDDALKIENDKMSDEEFGKLLSGALKNASEALNPGGGYYIFHADSEGENFRRTARESLGKVRQCLIWNKSALVMGRQDYHWKHEPCLYGWKEGASHKWNGDRKQTTVIEWDKPSRNGEHPTMKPVGLFDYLIRNSSHKNDIVLDLFLGSGTTTIACEQSGRVSYGMELDPKYVQVIIQRYIAFKGTSDDVYRINADGTKTKYEDIT